LSSASVLIVKTSTPSGNGGGTGGTSGDCADPIRTDTIQEITPNRFADRLKIRFILFQIIIFGGNFNDSTARGFSADIATATDEFRATPSKTIML